MMKSIIKKGLLFLSCVFILTSCFDNKETKISCYEYSGRPTQALKYKEVVSMLKQYDNTRTASLKTLNNGREDTRENFYALEDLKAYIAYVEKLAKDKKIKITGINIISAAYPNDTVAYRKKANYQTLIFMPATTIGTEKNVSFDPLYSEIGKPKRFDELLEKFNYFYRKPSRKMMKSLNPTDSIPDMESSAANRTHISPPY